MSARRLICRGDAVLGHDRRPLPDDLSARQAIFPVQHPDMLERRNPTTPFRLEEENRAFVDAKIAYLAAIGGLIAPRRAATAQIGRI